MTRHASSARPLGLAAALALVLAAGAPASAQNPSRADELLSKGDYLFKAGYYFKASEHYRLALLEDPSSPWKKLAFGHALYAIGNYSYASYALRRGVAELDPAEPFQADVASLFPSRQAFTQALRDLKRYVTFSPRDPAGLTVLGYILFSVEGEERRCRDMFLYLQRLDPADPFAAFFLDQFERRMGLPPLAGARPPRDPEEALTFPEAEPIVPARPTPEPRARDEEPARPARTPPTPTTPALDRVLPAPARQGEQLESEWPAPTPAPAE